MSTPTAAGDFCCEVLWAADTQVAAIGREIVVAGRCRLETAARDVAAVESAVAADRGRLMAARAHAARLAAARSARRAQCALVVAAVLAVIVLFLLVAR